MKVLVTGAGAVLGQGIIKSLRASSLGCAVIAADPNPLSAGLYWADHARRIPLAADPAYAAAIDDLLDRERPDAVLVGTDVELGFFAEHRAALEARYATRILVSDPRVVAIADDKFETFRFLTQAGFLPPASAIGEDAAGVARLIAEVGYPLVVKPRVGARSVGVSVVHDDAGLAAALERRSGLVVQECIGDADCEYTASAIVFDGETRAAIVMRRDLRDGNTYRAYCGDYPALEREVRALGAALRPYGPANFQFRTDRQGRPRVFEINARFSGTTPMRAMAGFNEVEMCLAHILRGRPIAQPAIREGVILRFLEEAFVSPEAIAGVGCASR